MIRFLKEIAPAVFLLFAALGLMFLALDAWENDCLRRERATKQHLSQWGEGVKPVEE